MDVVTILCVGGAIALVMGLLVWRKRSRKNVAPKPPAAPAPSILTDDERASLRQIIDERKNGVPAPIYPTTTPTEHQPQTVINVPAIDPHKESKTTKIRNMAIALMIIGAVGIFLLFAILALFVLLDAGVPGAMIIYIAGFYLFLLIAVLAIIVFVYYRIKLGPVWVYKDCVNVPGKALMLLWRKTGVVSLEAARYVAETFETDRVNKSQDPLAFFKNDVAPGILGRAGIGVFFDAANVMANPEFVAACGELRKLGYDNIELAKKDWEAKKLKITIPLFHEVNFMDLYDFVKGRPAITKAYCDTKVNEARAERDMTFMEKNKTLMALGFMGMFLMIGFGMAWAMTHGFSFS